MWEIQRQTDRKTLLGSAELAKRATQFLISARLFLRDPSSEEEEVSDVDTGETESEDIW